MFAKLAEAVGQRAKPAGFSLTELMAVLTILALLAVLIVPRVAGHHNSSKRSACYANQREVELQLKLWRRHTGAYPAADLGNLAADSAYFPEGLPTCPVDGTAYTIDTTTGRVIGHTH